MDRPLPLIRMTRGCVDSNIILQTEDRRLAAGSSVDKSSWHTPILSERRWSWSMMALNQQDPSPFVMFLQYNCSPQVWACITNS